jgi:23S rRNA pseudouridine1911/1915/1917 synthase
MERRALVISRSRPPEKPRPPPEADSERAIYEVAEAQAGERIDRLVATWRELSRASTKRLFEQEGVWLVPPGAPLRAQRRAAKGETCEQGARIVVRVEARPRAQLARPAARPDHAGAATLDVVLETDAVVIVDKPAGQPSAPLRADELGTIANGLLARYPEMALVGHGPLEPGLVHRLDNGTSGLLLAARTLPAFPTLLGAIQQGRLEKSYLLVCASAPLLDAGSIDIPLGPERHHDRRVIACTHDRPRTRGRPRPARTRYRVLERRGPHALVEVQAPRALRHQIRAHFAAIGAPLYGDELYGSTVAIGLGRHALHASRIEWPGDCELPAFSVRSPLPDSLRTLLD